MQTRTLTTARGDRVTYDAHGPVGEAGEATAVVFVAGAGPFRAADPATTACASALADRGVPALVHDRLGRGDSTVDGRIDIDREVAAIGALVEAAGGRVVLCGHSSGGAIALHAVTHGVPAGAVVCFEAPLDPSTPGVAAWTLEVERLLDAGDDEAALDHYLRDLPAELVGGLRSSPVWPAWVAHAPALRPDAQALRWAFAAPYDEGFGRELGARRVPVVAAHGTATFPEMPVAARAVAEAVPGGRVAEVPGENHTWEPASMADLLAEVARRSPER